MWAYVTFSVKDIPSVVLSKCNLIHMFHDCPCIISAEHVRIFTNPFKKLKLDSLPKKIRNILMGLFWHFERRTLNAHLSQETSVACVLF
jgi:hypothetical protein